MPKPVCVPCARFFRPYKNGTRVLEGMPVPSDTRPGLEDPDNWKPYKVWVADMYKCEGCGAEIVVGFGFSPMWERHYDRPQPHHHVRVNDC
jgi:hypothetical protein